MDDDQFCPHCKTSKYRNPSLKLYVNVCGHPLCENCLDLLFLKGIGNCTQCGLSLRKNNFRLRLFDDDFVEKEIDIRKKILKDFNKKEDDFNSLSEYDDYLEQIEIIIYNLTNNIDVDETKKLVEDYKKQNEDLIVKNREKLSKDEILIEKLLEQKHETESYRSKMDILNNTSQQLNKMKKLQKEALVDELMYSDLPASQILATHNNHLKIREDEINALKEDNHKFKLIEHQTTTNQRTKPSYFSTGIQQGKASNIFAPVPEDESRPYKYCMPELNIRGPNLPTLDELKKSGYMKHVRSLDVAEEAGGFQPYYSCYRALLDAFCGLYFCES